MEKYINEETIEKDNIYDLIKDKITCPICNNIMIEPVICLGCQTTFCKKCKKILKKKKQNCPNECKNPTISDVVEKNNMISKFKFKCIKGCGTEIPFKDINKHYNSDCLSKKKIVKIYDKKEMGKIKIKDMARLTSKYNKFISFYSNYIRNFWSWKIIFNIYVSFNLLIL